MQINLLGAIEVTTADGSTVAVGPLKRRVVLGLLAVEAGRVVATDRLIDAVWGDDPPASALATLQGLVYQLRQVLGAQAIESRPPGYAIDVSVETDVGRVTHASARAQSADELDDVLGLFRGRPLDDLGDGDVVVALRRHLSEQRLQLLGRWCTAALGEGRAAEVIDRVERELLAARWHEPLWEQLMIALYRSNRQADALAAFARARATLLDDLGLEPGPALRTLEQQILNQDPALDAPASATVALPSGDVTFLLTDIVGSTRMWEQSAEAMDVALLRQEEILQFAVGAHGGVLLKARGEGDSTFSVFGSPDAALAAAVDAQRALLAEAWPPEASLSIRMGLHSGEAIERNGDYFGPTVNRAARLRAIAAGSEILVSSTTVERCRELPRDVALEDIGVRQLRDVAEHVHVVRHPSLPVHLAAVTTMPTRRAAMAISSAAFVGRAGELAHLRQRHARSDGTGAVSLVLGEPGIGKTRLITEMAERLADDGFVVLWGRCPEHEWAAPYFPFVEALERYLSSVEPDVARRLLSAVAAPLAPVLPIVTELFANVAPVGEVDVELRRFEILDGLSRLLEGVAASNPVLIVLDDLHWVDQSSAWTLSFLAPLTSRAAVHIVGTYRDTEVPDTHPLAVALASAHRDVRIDRIRLRGMSPSMGRELIEQFGLVDAHESMVDELMGASGGNPFFLGELVRFRAENTELTIPDSVNDTIRRRLARLSPETNLLIRIGSLFDERFPLEPTRMVADLGEGAVLDAVDEAIAAQIIEPTDVPDEYRFLHALVRVAAQSTINPSRLPRLHRRIATTLEEQRLPGDVAVLARIAFHYHASRVLPGAERGVEAALESAAHAESVAAHRERATLLRLALGLMQPADVRRARVTAELAKSFVRAGALDDEPEVEIEAGDLLAATEGGQAACDFFAELRMIWEDTGGESAERMIRWTERGMALAEHVPSDSYDLLYASSVLNRIGLLGEDHYRERAVLWADPGMVKIGERFLRREIKVVNRWAAAAAAHHRDDLARLPITQSMFHLPMTGDYTVILESSSRYAEWFRQQGLHGSLVRSHSYAARAAACLGKLDTAEQHLSATLELMSPSIDPIFLLAAASTQLVIHWVTDGPWDAFKDKIDSLCSILPLAAAGWEAGQQHAFWPTVNATAMIMQGRGGELDRAADAANLLVDYVEVADVHEYWYTFVTHACAEIAWLAADTTLASRLEGPIRTRWLPCDFRYFGCDVRLSLARLCAIDGRVVEAAGWFAAARAEFAAQQAWPLSAIAGFDEAWMHVRHPGHADLSAVHALIDRAAAEFTAIEMTGWIRRAADLRSELATSE